MKLIEAMKKQKDLLKKAEDLRQKISVQCAHLSYETPTYGEHQAATVKGWLQAHGDICKEILELRLGIQRTNIQTVVGITINDVLIKKTIAEWIHRRRDIAKLQQSAWLALGDRGLKEASGRNSTGDLIEVKIVRNFNPKERDEYVEILQAEPSTIDAALEVANAITDVVTK